MGRLAMGNSALGDSSDFDVKVSKDTPGPHRMTAWNPGAGILVACGMLTNASPQQHYQYRFGGTWSQIPSLTPKDVQILD
jgi:hypothetical protein